MNMGEWDELYLFDLRGGAELGGERCTPQPFYLGWGGKKSLVPTGDGSAPIQVWAVWIRTKSATPPANPTVPLLSSPVPSHTISAGFVTRNCPTHGQRTGLTALSRNFVLQQLYAPSRPQTSVATCTYRRHRILTQHSQPALHYETCTHVICNTIYCYSPMPTDNGKGIYLHF